MYAIVRCGGRQQKVSVGDVLEVDKVAGEVGSRISLPTVLVVNDGDVTTDAPASSPLTPKFSVRPRVRRSGF